MGFYNVVRPCVVGKLHYATVPAQPIEVDDDVAAPLVESGCLAPYGPNHANHVHVAVSDLEGSIFGEAVEKFTDPAYVAPTIGAEFVAPLVIEQDEAEKPRPRNPRRPKD